MYYSMTTTIFQGKGLQVFFNNHLWAEDNLHAIKEGQYQYKVSLALWVEIIGENIIEPFFHR